MGQSFLTHDEKSSQSPSPDLLQFNGVSHPKFFGSLSSVKETSVSSSSRSRLESTDSERNFRLGSCSSSSSPRSPPQIATSDETPYSTLIPAPILPGNVNRLREKFMDFDAKPKRSTDEERKEKKSSVQNPPQKKDEETISDLDCRFISRPVSANPYYVSINRTHHRRAGTLPTSPRSRSSLHTLNPTSRHAVISRNRISLPAASPAYEKLDVIRSDNDLSECFRQMTLGTSGNVPSFSNVTPLVRHRPRARPYVPQLRSVIIRAGYLPVVETVNVIPTRPSGTRASITGGAGADIVDSSTTVQDKQSGSSNNECFTTGGNTPKNNLSLKEDLLLVSSSSSKKQRPDESKSIHIVTNQGDHTIEKKVLTKDAEVNTSAEVLVLPKGTKSSVLLKSVGLEVDGKPSSLRRRKKKRGVTRRVARAFGRIMIRLVEFF